MLSITNQLTTILTVRNVEQQVKTLGNEDVLIVPDLWDLSSTDFDRSPEAVIIGYDAAQTKRKELSRLSLSAADYQAPHRRATVNTRYRPSRHRLHPDQEQHPIVRPNHRQSIADPARRPTRPARAQPQPQHHLWHGRFPGGRLLVGQGKRQDRVDRRSQ